jgi:hypothetical protein
MANNVMSEISCHPFVAVIANLLSEKADPESTLLDLRGELNRSMEVVEKLILRYGDDVQLTDSTTQPIG